MEVLRFRKGRDVYEEWHWTEFAREKVDET